MTTNNKKIVFTTAQNVQNLGITGFGVLWKFQKSWDFISTCNTLATYLQQPIKKDNFLEVHPEQGKHLFFRPLR